MTEVVSQRSSIIQFKLGSRTYDAVHSSGCSVCTHPARFVIEEKILENYSAPAIVRYISDHSTQSVDGSEIVWPEINLAMLRHHKDSGHCSLDGQMLTQFAEERMRQLGMKVEDSIAPFVDHVITTKLVLKRGQEAIVKGEIKPDVKDTLAAAKMLSDLEANSQSGASLDQWQEFMEIYFNEVRKVVDDDQWRKIGNAIARHPVMRVLQNTEVQDAELVEN